MAKPQQRTNEKDELKKILRVEEKDREETKTMSIIYDGRQYAIRLPKKFGQIAHINKDKDKFIFEIKIPHSHKQDPILVGRLVKG